MLRFFFIKFVFLKQMCVFKFFFYIENCLFKTYSSIKFFFITKLAFKNVYLAVSYLSFPRASNITIFRSNIIWLDSPFNPKGCKGLRDQPDLLRRLLFCLPTPRIKFLMILQRFHPWLIKTISWSCCCRHMSHRVDVHMPSANTDQTKDFKQKDQEGWPLPALDLGLLSRVEQLQVLGHDFATRVGKGGGGGNE
jgi:hypothetical protein